jgi:hypothetical protein
MDGMQETFTTEEICEQAKGNVGALSLLLLTYARDRGHPLDAAARFFGRVFAPSWDEVSAGDARTAGSCVAWRAMRGTRSPSLAAGRWTRILASSGCPSRRRTGSMRCSPPLPSGWDSPTHGGGTAMPSR